MPLQQVLQVRGHLLVVGWQIAWPWTRAADVLLAMVRCNLQAAVQLGAHGLHSRSPLKTHVIPAHMPNAGEGAVGGTATRAV